MKQLVLARESLLIEYIRTKFLLPSTTALGRIPGEINQEETRDMAGILCNRSHDRSRLDGGKLWNASRHHKTPSSRLPSHAGQKYILSRIQWAMQLQTLWPTLFPIPRGTMLEQSTSITEYAAAKWPEKWSEEKLCEWNISVYIKNKKTVWNQ